jgi:hypothetical protein
MSFDISKMAVADTATIDLELPDGEPMMVPGPDGEDVQASITIYGPGSKEHARAVGKRNRAVVDAVRKGSKKLSDDDQRAIDATFLAECTASLNHFHYKDLTGFEAAKGLYMDASVGYIAEQVNRAINSWGNFFKRPATN